MMSEPFLGEIMMVGFSFAPRYWAMCQGQTMAAAQNQALFTLLGATYGGNGVTTFMLPDLQARIPVHFSSSVPLGATGGVPSVTLTTQQIADHTHPVNATAATGNSTTPTTAYLASMMSSDTPPIAVGGYVPATVDPTTITNLIPPTVGSFGATGSHDNRQPVMGLNYIIALSGIFPSKP